MDRICYFPDPSNLTDAVTKVIAWLSESEGGATLIADDKGTATRSLRHLARAGKEEEWLGTRGISLQTLRGGFSLRGDRVALLYPSVKCLGEVEERLFSPMPSSNAPSDLLVLVWNEAQALEWCRRYAPRVIGNVPAGWKQRSARADTSNVPEDIRRILALVAGKVESYGYLKFNERDRLKADMMINWSCWKPVSTEECRAVCYELGMPVEATDEVVGMLDNRHQGKRLQVKQGERGYVHNP